MSCELELVSLRLRFYGTTYVGISTRLIKPVDRKRGIGQPLTHGRAEALRQSRRIAE